MPRGVRAGHSPPRADARTAAVRLVVVVAVLASTTTCQQFLGDVEILTRDAGRRPRDTGPPPPPDLCTQGEYRCQGPALQKCKGDRQGYLTLRVCSSAALCDAAATVPQCRVPTCLAGSYECLTIDPAQGTQLRVCADDGSRWTLLSTCLSEAHCNASLGRCTDLPCQAGVDAQCNGDVKQSCDAAGWVDDFACPDAPALCDPASTSCRPEGCETPDGLVPFLCDDADFLRCKDDRTGFERVETCLNAAHCNAFFRDPEFIGETQVGEMPLDKLLALGCSEPECTPGRWACDGAVLSRCDGNRRRYRNTDEQTCASPGRCDARNGRCAEQPCVNGTTQCSGRQWQVCRRDAWVDRGEPCDRASLCDHSDGCLPTPATCHVTEYRCQGPALERCNVDGNGWIPVQTCESAPLCDPYAKRCNPPICDPGQLLCDRQGVRRQCAPERHEWRELENCPQLVPGGVPATFVTGLCDLESGCLPEPTCEFGTFRCNGRDLERCQTTGVQLDNAELQANVWFPFERCASSALCDAAAQTCNAPQCELGEARCVTAGAEPVVAEPGDPTEGLTLQVCGIARTGFETAQTCTPDQRCDARHAQCDICEPLAPVCLQDVLQRCSGDGQEYEREMRCPNGCGPLADAGVGSVGCL